MKKFKKILAMLLAMTMILAMSISVFADGEEPGDGGSNGNTPAVLTPDDSISVTGLNENDTVNCYQIIKWVGGEGWKLAEGFTGLSEVDFTAILNGNLTKDIADNIAALAKDVNPLGIDKSVSSGSWTVDNPAAGLYMVIPVAGTSGVVYNPAFVASDFDRNTTNTISIEAMYGDSSIAKKQTITLDKTAKDSANKIDTALDHKVGDLVDFEVKTVIPVFLKSYQDPSFVLKDEVKTDGIKLVPDTIKITLGDELVTGDEYTLTKTEKGYTVDFKKTYLENNAAPVNVTITYKGKITNEAKFNVNQDRNEVTVVYANGPETQKGALKDATNHYTFTIGGELLGNSEITTYELVKVGMDKDGHYITETKKTYENKEVGTLADAVFGLYTNEACTDKYTNDLYPEGATFTTTDTGIITFKGLDAGTYWMKEISAPDGYIKDKYAHKIEISAEYSEKKVEETVNDIAVTYSVKTLDSYEITIDNKKTSTYNFTNDGPVIESTDPDIHMTEIVNTKGTELPSTGGMGTTLFYIIGAILVIGAGVILVARRRIDK